MAIMKLGFDIVTLVDLEGAETEMKELWYDKHKPETDMSFDEYGRAIFHIVRPRPGALGLLRDLRQEGCRLLFFTDIVDPIAGDRAEKWLQEWSVTTDLELHTIKTDQGQSPIQLDCQAYVLPEDHGYEISKDRPRVATHKRGGPFDRKVVDKVRELPDVPTE